jgi:hypothetical protein
MSTILPPSLTRLLVQQKLEHKTPLPPQQPQSTMSLTEQTAMEFTADFFDTSSAAWHANKIRRGHSYVYRCEAVTKAGTSCKHPASSRPKDPATPNHFCKTHARKHKSI